jgi:hypothetical protein
VEEFIPRTKNNKATGYEGIPPEFWKIFCTVRDESETLTNVFNKKNGKEFPLTGKLLTHTQFIRESETKRHQ